MKKGIHPQDYRDVVFQDEAAGFMFLTKSTAQTDETITYEGKEYPLVKIYVSSKSHPFFTGEEKIIDTEGRVDRFAAKMKAAETAKKAKLEKLTAKKTSVAKPSTSREASGAVAPKPAEETKNEEVKE